MDNSLFALGLMSGTSLDGIDASIIKSDGENYLDIIDNKYLSYPVDLKKRLSYFINQINDKNDIKENIGIYKSLEREITLYHAQISRNIIDKNKCKIQVVGFHGQTIIHKPKDGYSVQKVERGKKIPERELRPSESEEEDNGDKDDDEIEDRTNLQQSVDNDEAANGGEEAITGQGDQKLDSGANDQHQNEGGSIDNSMEIRSSL